MYRKHCILFITTVILILFSQASAQELDRIPFTISSGGHILIQTNITDELNGMFVFDTGAGVHVLAEKHKKNLNIKSTGFFTAFTHEGERLRFELFQTPSIRLGTVVEKEPYIIFWDELDKSGVDGLFSLKIFENLPVTLDLKNNMIIVETEESLKKLMKTGRTILIEFQRYRDKALDIFAYFKINDKINAEFEIDTGSGNRIIMDKSYLNILGFNSTSVDDKKSVRKTVQKISLSAAPEVSIENQMVIFKNKLIYDGVIGIGIWQDRKLTIDIPNKRMIVNTD